MGSKPDVIANSCNISFIYKWVSKAAYMNTRFII